MAGRIIPLEKKYRAYQLFMEGIPTTEIADKLEIHFQTVRNWAYAGAWKAELNKVSSMELINDTYVLPIDVSPEVYEVLLKEAKASGILPQDVLAKRVYEMYSEEASNV